MKKAIVVGSGVSGISTAYLIKKHLGLSVSVIEKERLGGKAITIRTNGYLIETGPNGFLSNKAEIKKLIEESHFEDQLIQSNDEANKKFIFSLGKLWEIPNNPLKLIFSGFLSTKAKLNILKEPFVKPYPNDETVESFVKRRLGEEFLNKVIGPMVCGVFAGDPKIMSMESNFKRIKEIERKYGSLIKGLISLMINKKTNASATTGGFSSKLMSFKGGILSFLNHLAKDIEIVNDTVFDLKREGNKYALRGKRSTYTADIVVFAIPSYALQEILKNHDYGFSKILSKIPYAPMSVVALGYEDKDLPDVKNSFGYLFDLNEIRDVIGVLFDSSIFNFRAEKGKVLIRFMVGGQLAKDAPFKRNIVESVVKELQRSASIFKPFEFSFIKRHKKAIPVYTMEHRSVLEAIREFEHKNRGIFIAGNAFYGVGLNDCVKAAYLTLEKIKGGQ